MLALRPYSADTISKIIWETGRIAASSSLGMLQKDQILSIGMPRLANDHDARMTAIEIRAMLNNALRTL